MVRSTAYGAQGPEFKVQGATAAELDARTGARTAKPGDRYNDEKLFTADGTNRNDGLEGAEGRECRARRTAR